MMNIQDVESHFFGKLLPIIFAPLDESSQNIPQGSRNKEILLPNDELLNSNGLIWIFWVWGAGDLFAFLSGLNDVFVLVLMMSLRLT